MQRALLGWVAFFIGYYCLSAVFVLAQDSAGITVERIYSDEANQLFASPDYKWLDDGRLLWFDKRVDTAERSVEVMDPETGQCHALFDMHKALAGIRGLTENMDTVTVLPWPDAWQSQGQFAVWVFNDDLFLLDIASDTFRRLTSTEAAEECVQVSPDGRYVSFVRDNDLYLVSVADGRERRLTRDGSDTRLNGTLSWLYWEEIFSRTDGGYWWSPDSKSIAFLHSEQAAVDTMYYVTFDSTHAKVDQQYFPRPGGANPTVTLGIASIGRKSTVWMTLPSTSYEYIVNVNWCPGSEFVAVETMNRGQTELDLHLVNPTNGSVKRLLTETDSIWVNASAPRFLSDTDRMLFLSDRDGYPHLYLYNLKGELLNRVTQGDWVVMADVSHESQGQSHSLAVDEAGQWVYFIGTEHSMVERRLYRARLDGSSLECLTAESGSVNASFSPDMSHYMVQHSSLASPPTYTLYRRDGSRVAVLDGPADERLSQLQLQTPALATVQTPDGLALPCSITKPRDFDPKRRYPIIMSVYGGPGIPVVVDRWRGRYALLDEMLLDSGFVLVACDNRSSAPFSRKQSDAVKGRIWGDIELADLLTVVHWLKGQPWVDSSRIGITGWSGGGTYTLLAMTHSTEFKAGIAGAPATDWRYYDTKYTEALMGLPSDNPRGYIDESLVNAAKDLHGRLLLIFGTGDDNVHAQHSWAFIDELVKGGKTFEMMAYPARKHYGWEKAANIHRETTVIEFWMRNL